MKALSEGRWLALFLAGAAVLLTVTAVPGVLTIDENNYLSTVVALRRGTVFLPGTEGKTPTFELYWSDPYPRARPEARSPVPTVAPPLYAWLALPFSLAGWRGLLGLNTLSFVAAAALVFAFARRYSTRPSSAWLAMGTFCFGAFNLEYAQGAWPHMLSVALCLGGLYALSRVREGHPERGAALGGALLGLAVGVRYQNIAIAGAAGLGLLLFAQRRGRASAWYALGLSGPLAACSALNHARTGSWHPFSKAPGYTQLAGASIEPSAQLETLGALWAKVIDFSAHPPIVGVPLGPVPAGVKANWGWQPDALGAFLWHGAVKKAWLQSCPWLLLALLFLAMGWGATASEDAPQRRERRALFLVVAALLGVMALGGYGRQDGLCFNQRYLLELVPLACISLAWAFDRSPVSRTSVLAGALASAALAATALLAEPGSFVRSVLLLKVPLALGFLLPVAWLLGARGRAPPRVAGLLLGASLLWAGAAHLGDDYPVARRLRAYTLTQTTFYRDLLPDRAALIAFGPAKDPAGPLLLEKDLVVVDPLVDGGADLPRLVEELHRDGRRVFLDFARFPSWVSDPLRDTFSFSVVAPGRDPVVELLPKS